ncbi:hypothetical protein B0H13DRAFT_1858231 [Mycena leptocephala]|nr:hypothetical protein B0H13DRAFT_1858231 [Mycena leptocephala]
MQLFRLVAFAHLITLAWLPLRCPMHILFYFFGWKSRIDFFLQEHMHVGEARDSGGLLDGLTVRRPPLPVNVLIDLTIFHRRCAVSEPGSRIVELTLVLQQLGNINTGTAVKANTTVDAIGDEDKPLLQLIEVSLTDHVHGKRKEERGKIGPSCDWIVVLKEFFSLKEGPVKQSTPSHLRRPPRGCVDPIVTTARRRDCDGFDRPVQLRRSTSLTAWTERCKRLNLDWINGEIGNPSLARGTPGIFVEWKSRELSIPRSARLVTRRFFDERMSGARERRRRACTRRVWAWELHTVNNGIAEYSESIRYT